MAAHDIVEYTEKLAGTFMKGSATENLIRKTVGWTGKNLLKHEATSRNLGGVVFTPNDDGSITVNGTNSSTGYTWYEFANFNGFPEGSYIMTGAVNDNIRLKFRRDPTGGYDVDDTGNGKNIDITSSMSSDNYVMFIAIKPGVTVNNAIVYPMIRRADVVDDTYEPYHETVEKLLEDGGGSGHTIVNTDGIEFAKRSKLKILNANITDDEANDTTIVDPSTFTRTFTARFNLSDSNPETWGEYLDDAVGMTVGSDAWEEKLGIIPVVLADGGGELGELDHNDATKYVTGAAAPITTLGNDAMTKYPRAGVKIYIENGYLYVSITTGDNVDGYDYNAHSYKGVQCSAFYLGRYKMYVSGDKGYSVSGQTPTTNKTISAFRTAARARGTGYEQSAFHQLKFRQAFYLLKYLGKNAQTAVGRGFVDGNSAVYGATGSTNDKGCDWGETTGKYPMCLQWLEDFFGNIWEFIDGIWSDSNRNIWVSDGDFNDTGSGYTNVGSSGFTSDTGGYMQQPMGTNLAGFVPWGGKISGSETTYFCDHADVDASRMAIFGGRWANASSAGVFRLYVGPSASGAAADVGARLMFLKTK